MMLETPCHRIRLAFLEDASVLGFPSSRIRYFSIINTHTACHVVLGDIAVCISMEAPRSKVEFKRLRL